MVILASSPEFLALYDLKGQRATARELLFQFVEANIEISGKMTKKGFIEVDEDLEQQRHL